MGEVDAEPLLFAWVFRRFIFTSQIGFPSELGCRACAGLEEIIRWALDKVSEHSDFCGLG